MKVDLLFANQDGEPVLYGAGAIFPRAPTSGDLVRLPDNDLVWRVEFVTFDFSAGWGKEAKMIVELERINA